jgi:RNA polymerase sigma-70 factor (ECF subfamily)
VTRTEEFEELRPLLFAIAYRILGSVTEAEDAVQETLLRYESSPRQQTSTKAFLSAVVTRVSIDVLRSARVRRETYVGQWFPEPLLTDPYADPARSAELADSLSMAALLLLERLTPLERACLRAAGGVRVRIFGGFSCRRSVGGGVPPAGGPGATPHGGWAPSVRG